MKIEMKVTKFENEDVMTASFRLVNYGNGNVADNKIIYHAQDNGPDVVVYGPGANGTVYADLIKGLRIDSDMTVEDLNSMANLSYVKDSSAVMASYKDTNWRVAGDWAYKNTQ